MLKYYKQAREEIMPFGESKYKEAAPLSLFCAVGCSSRSFPEAEICERWIRRPRRRRSDCGSLLPLPPSWMMRKGRLPPKLRRN